MFQNMFVYLEVMTEHDVIFGPGVYVTGRTKPNDQAEEEEDWEEGGVVQWHCGQRTSGKKILKVWVSLFSTETLTRLLYVVLHDIKTTVPDQTRKVLGSFVGTFSPSASVLWPVVARCVTLTAVFQVVVFMRSRGSLASRPPKARETTTKKAAAALTASWATAGEVMDRREGAVLQRPPAQAPPTATEGWRGWLWAHQHKTALFLCFFVFVAELLADAVLRLHHLPESPLVAPETQSMIESASEG